MPERQSPSDGDAQYSTLGVSHATGIPMTTILAWERRYGLPRPQRDAAGRRCYSAADLTLLLAMRARTAEGVRAELAARELLQGEPADAPRARPRLVHLPTEIKDVHCLHCGEASGELQIQHGPHGTRVRFLPAPGAVPPRRGPGDRPRCGRCHGDLLAEARESRTLPPFPGTATPAPRTDAA